jgi:hypothetical protein
MYRRLSDYGGQAVLVLEQMRQQKSIRSPRVAKPAEPFGDISRTRTSTRTKIQKTNDLRGTTLQPPFGRARTRLRTGFVAAGTCAVSNLKFRARRSLRRRPRHALRATPAFVIRAGFEPHPSPRPHQKTYFFSAFFSDFSSRSIFASATG